MHFKKGLFFWYNFLNRKEDQTYEKSHNFRNPSCQSNCSGGCITNNKHPEQEIIKNENVNLAIYLENEQTTSIPSKDSGYYFDREKSSCTNDATITWDSVTWSPVILNAENYPVRCELHFTTTYTEGILNGTDPVLKDELVPITIQNDGTVKKQI